MISIDALKEGYKEAKVKYAELLKQDRCENVCLKAMSAISAMLFSIVTLHDWDKYMAQVNEAGVLNNELYEHQKWSPLVFEANNRRCVALEKTWIVGHAKLTTLISDFEALKLNCSADIMKLQEYVSMMSTSVVNSLKIESKRLKSLEVQYLSREIGYKEQLCSLNQAIQGLFIANDRKSAEDGIIESLTREILELNNQLRDLSRQHHDTEAASAKALLRFQSQLDENNELLKHNMMHSSLQPQQQQLELPTTLLIDSKVSANENILLSEGGDGDGAVCVVALDYCTLLAPCYLSANISPCKEESTTVSECPMENHVERHHSEEDEHDANVDTVTDDDINNHIVHGTNNINGDEDDDLNSVDAYMGQCPTIVFMDDLPDAFVPHIDDPKLNLININCDNGNNSRSDNCALSETVAQEINQSPISLSVPIDNS